MNQILSVENTKKEKKQKVKTKNSGPIEIHTILRFFSIVLIVFGICMVGSGSYSMYLEAKANTVPTKPVIFVKDISETEITLEITHDKSLGTISYWWNEEEPTRIDAKGKKKIEETIKIPTGNNILNISAIDINGEEATLEKPYNILGDINIELQAEDGGDLKITVNAKAELSYMTYRWDEGEEQRIDLTGTNTEQVVAIPKGQHTLTVIVVDVNNKTETKIQEVKGVTKPTVDVTTDGSSNFIIKASDEEGIKKVEFIINDGTTNVLNLDQVYPLEQRKKFEYAYPLHDGENYLEIRVYNESDIMEVKKVVVRK